MTDTEYDVLDELYFIQSFQNLLEVLKIGDTELLETLDQLIKKGWVKCFKEAQFEVMDDEIDLMANYNVYSYLATKQGLFAHNSAL